MGAAEAIDSEYLRAFHSDAASALVAGHDVRTAVIAYAGDASHSVERTHIESLTNVVRMLEAYTTSAPTFPADAELTTVEHFSHQIDAGTLPRRREEPLERGADRGDPSEGERGGEEGDRFAIRGVGITVRKEKGIRVETSSAPLFLEGGEARPQGVEVGTSEPPSHLAGSIRVRGSLSDPPGGIAW